MSDIHLELQKASLQLASEHQNNYFARVVSLGLTDLMFGANAALFTAMPDRPYEFIAAWLEENRGLVKEKTSEIVETQVGTILKNLRDPVRVLPRLSSDNDDLDTYFEENHSNKDLGAKLKVINNCSRERESNKIIQTSIKQSQKTFDEKKRTTRDRYRIDDQKEKEILAQIERHQAKERELKSKEMSRLLDKQYNHRGKNIPHVGYQRSESVTAGERDAKRKASRYREGKAPLDGFKPPAPPSMLTAGANVYPQPVVEILPAAVDKELRMRETAEALAAARTAQEAEAKTLLDVELERERKNRTMEPEALAAKAEQEAKKEAAQTEQRRQEREKTCELQSDDDINKTTYNHQNESLVDNAVHEMQHFDARTAIPSVETAASVASSDSPRPKQVTIDIEAHQNAQPSKSNHIDSMSKSEQSFASSGQSVLQDGKVIDNEAAVKSLVNAGKRATLKIQPADLRVKSSLVRSCARSMNNISINFNLC